ncbi:hypothetical protein ACFW5V_32450 [Streptomyces sp. NPDC058762]|uniref:hypothetical protein n=1 Tax=Streptomyces sp. NPDC058762 TaxID=3346629 RepID=UPI0036BB3846
MPAANLTPVSVLDDALAQARAAARAVLALVAETLHHQFPTGAYLVLTRPSDDAYDVEGDRATLDSVRDDRGEIVQNLDPFNRGSYRLPAVPDDVAALWGSTDPRNLSAVNDLIQRIDAIAPYEFLDFLPLELRTADEVKAEGDGGRRPLGLPLRAVHIEPSTGA